MVQGTRTQIIKQAILRFLLLFGAAVIAFLTQPFFQDFLTITLDYQEPAGFFGALYGLETAFLGLFFAFVFWVSIMFGILGTKVDYILISILLGLGLLLFSQEVGITFEMYLGLVGVALLGNFLGYMLKLARERWLGQKM